MDAKKPRIIVAEDDNADWFILQMAFDACKTPANVTRVENGRKLVDYLQALDAKLLPDLVVMDLNMPEMDGLEALEFIRKHSRLSSLPVVIYSTASSDYYERLCELLGVNAYVRKATAFPDCLEQVTGFLALCGERN